MRISDWSSDVCSSEISKSELGPEDDQHRGELDDRRRDVEQQEIKHRVDALGPALDHLGHLARPPRAVKAQAQRMKMAEGRDRQFARRILPDSLEDDVAQIVEQHPGEKTEKPADREQGGK